MQPYNQENSNMADKFTDAKIALDAATARALGKDTNQPRTLDEITARALGRDTNQPRTLDEITARAYCEHARTLFTRLSDGDITGYKDADTMAEDIRNSLKLAQATAAALDLSGKKSADEMTRALKEAVLNKKFGIGSRPGRNPAED